MSARAIDCCSPVFMFLIVTSPRARSSPPTTATNAASRADAYLNCFPELVGLRIQLGPQARRRAAPPPARSESSIEADRRCVTSTSGPPVWTRRREHAAFGHHHEDPLQAERKPARRNLLAREHADQPVVAAAAAQAADALDRDLHDGAGVVRQPARQARVDNEVSRGAGPCGRAAGSPPACRRRQSRPPPLPTCSRARRRLSSLTRAGSTLATADRRTRQASVRRPRPACLASRAPCARRPPRSCPACRARPAPDREARRARRSCRASRAAARDGSTG